jgi:SAM-dependent methyltransferase
LAGEPEGHWERAGKVGYATAMYASDGVAHHVIRRVADEAMATSAQIGLGSTHRVLELGCGDGAFAIDRLAPAFAEVRAFDLSRAAIERASAAAFDRPHVRFEATDITTLDLEALGSFDGAFLMGILHHVKPQAEKLLRSLARVAPRVVVLEPNGDHVLRKLLELTPSYRRAGEDSFTESELSALFGRAGFEVRTRRRMNIFPNFTPRFVFRLVRGVESRIERSRVLNALCTASVVGLVRSTEARERSPGSGPSG